MNSYNNFTDITFKSSSLKGRNNKIVNIGLHYPFYLDTDALGWAGVTRPRHKNTSEQNS
jgi:hypothetical protein